VSAPARRIERQAVPRRAHAPAHRRPAPARPAFPARRPVAPTRRSAGTRPRRHHLGFAILASAIVGSMMFAIVILHVLLAQQSFRIDETQRRIQTLSTVHLDLARSQATLSAPGRIATWATRHGMRLPDSIRILRAPKGSSDPTGAGTTGEGVEAES
jgi:cell division protein FtsL